MRRTIWMSFFMVVIAGCAAGEDDPRASDAAATSGPGGAGGGPEVGGSGGGPSSTGAGGDPGCSMEGETAPCYGGDPDLAGIGSCEMGTHTCEVSGEFLSWGDCLGWGEPTLDVCNGLDDDCNGTTDDGCCVPAQEVCDGVDNDCNGVADEGCCVASPEVCDGIDNDCDGFVDNGANCGPGSCGGGAGPCIELPIPPPTPLVSGCKQTFPPTQTLPCPIANPGTQYYVSSTSGNDANDGLTPATAWATLCYAVGAAAPMSTIQVAEGSYASAYVYVGKELTVKGGYDASFTTWDPDAHQSIFYGRVTLDHNAAVFGGFRIIANALAADSWSYPHHFVGAGTLVRNYIEIVATSGADPNVLNLYGIVASACPNGITVLRCNDIYVRSSAPQAFVVSAIEYGNHALHAGQGVLDSNRICQDGGSGATDAIGGYGSCVPNAVSLLMKNNVIEKTGGAGGEALSFYSCSTGDMNFVLTNNTILSSGSGIQSSGDPAVLMTWKLTNNILYGTGNGGTAIDVGSAGVQITTSENNLTFGFASNGISPVPLSSSGDDTSGAATPASVFVNAAAGDLTLQPNGQGAGTGLNVHAIPAYGDVTTDVMQAPRPTVGSWDRGAYGL